MRQRFGVWVQAIVVFVSIFNMSIALLVEYVGLGSLFRDYVGAGSSVPIVVVMGVLTIAYTAYGGLEVSIITDRIQVCGCVCVCGWVCGCVRCLRVRACARARACVCVCACKYVVLLSLFRDYVGAGSSAPIVVVMGVLTIAYTAYGGLEVSIITDRIQVCGCVCVCGWVCGCVRCLRVRACARARACVCVCACKYVVLLSLFRDYVGAGSSAPIVVVMGVLTIAYTAYGGLEVSIITDRIQV